MEWKTIWAQAPVGTAVFACAVGGRTTEMQVPAHLGGSAVRLRFAAPYDKEPVRIEKAAVTVARGGETKVYPVGLHDGLALPPGCSAVSEAVEAQVRPGDAISVRLAFGVGCVPLSGNALVPCRHSAPGDFTQVADFPAAADSIWLSPQRPFETGEPVATLVGIDLLSDGPGGVAVLGDSNSFLGTWTGPLATRLPGPLLNLAISGNRLLEGTIPLLQNLFGDAATNRFAWDVAPLCGIKTMLVAVGGNDIFQPGTKLGPPANTLPTFEEMRAGYEAMVKAAREQGLRVLCATITPFGGAEAYNEQKAALRRQVNEWLRTGNAFDGVLDLAALVEDTEIEALLPECDAGDHIHLSAAGGARIAQGIDVTLL